MDENIEELRKKLEFYEKQYGLAIEKRGLKNWKNLFRKPTIQDWTILFMLIMMLFVAWSYQHDVATCKEYIKQQQENFISSGSSYNIIYPELNISKINISKIIIKEDSEKIGEDNNT